MEKCLGIISYGEEDKNFGGLCKHRPGYMLPFGGRYRLIDFAISNMVNHGLQTIAIYTGDKIRSTMDHVGNGKPWDLNRRFNGLILFPPVYNEEIDMQTGEIPQFYSTLEFLNLIREEYVYMANPSIIAKIDLNKAFKKFKDTDADISLIYKKQYDPMGELINTDKLHLDKKGNMINMGLNLGTEKSFNHFLSMGFIKKEVFINIIKASIEKGNARSFREAMLQYKSDYKINSFEFQGHVEVIRDLKSFYDANLNLLKREISKELFFDRGLIFTKTKDEPSTLYTESSNVQNSLIANGCIIEGEVENSVIFRGVKVGKGAVVKNSIVMQKAQIEDEALVVNSILDKRTIIEEGARIAGSGIMPYVVEKYKSIKKD